MSKPETRKKPYIAPEQEAPAAPATPVEPEATVQPVATAWPFQPPFSAKGVSVYDNADRLVCVCAGAGEFAERAVYAKTIAGQMNQ